MLGLRRSSEAMAQLPSAPAAAAADVAPAQIPVITPRIVLHPGMSLADVSFCPLIFFGELARGDEGVFKKSFLFSFFFSLFVFLGLQGDQDAVDGQR
jgi:hypothetical protein